MTAHLSDDQIRGYRARSLEATELLDISKHIGRCEACRTRIASPDELAAHVRRVQVVLRSEASPVHLSYEQIEAYVDGTSGSDDRTALEAHARECQSCAADLREIQMLRTELDSPRLEREAGSRWADFWNAMRGWRGGLVLATAAGVVLAVVLLRPPVPQNPGVAQGNPPAGAAPLVATGSQIKDGTHLFSMAAGGRITGLEALAEADRGYVERALAEKRIAPAAALANLAANRGVLLGAPTEAPRGKLLAPLGTVVEDQQPVFRWQPLSGATYRVSVYTTEFDLVAASDWLSGTEWQIPKPLRRSGRYSWQVTVRQNGAEFTVPAPPAPEARFQVLALTDEEEIARLKNQWGDSHLVLGILYARAGLLDDAQRELQALRNQNPGSPEAASLLVSVEQLRGAATK